MQNARYYREQAERAWRWAGSIGDPELRKMLERLAQDYEDIAVDLELGAIEIRHPEILPQRNRDRKEPRP